MRRHYTYTNPLKLFHYHAFYCVVFICLALISVISELNLWSINEFRWVLLSLGMYEMLGHVSYAITEHSVNTKIKMIDHGNRIIDGMLHGLYAILFLHSSLHDKYGYHWISIIHSWLCIYHIFKYSPYGNNGFRSKLRQQRFMNLLDAFLHFSSFIKLVIENGMFHNVMNNTVYLCVSYMYVAMRQRHLIW